MSPDEFEIDRVRRGLAASKLRLKRELAEACESLDRHATAENLARVRDAESATRNTVVPICLDLTTDFLHLVEKAAHRKRQSLEGYILTAVMLDVVDVLDYNEIPGPRYLLRDVFNSQLGR